MVLKNPFKASDLVQFNRDYVLQALTNHSQDMFRLFLEPGHNSLNRIRRMETQWILVGDSIGAAVTHLTSYLQFREDDQCICTALSLCLCVCVCTRHSTCVELKGWLVRVGSLYWPCEFCGSNVDQEAWQWDLYTLRQFMAPRMFFMTQFMAPRVFFMAGDGRDEW